MRKTCLLALILCAAALAQRKDRTVVVVSIDGLPAYMLDDPKLPMPTLRKLMREGAVARRMRESNPSVTWPSHTSMVTGVWPAKHGVLFNGIYNGEKVEPWRPKPEMVLAPTVYDAAHKAGLTTSQVDWVAIYQAPTITWQFAEIPDPKGPIEREMMAAGLITADEVAGFGKGNILWRDRMWTLAGQHILRRHKPNLLLFHLLAMDTVHHRHGPGTVASQAVAAFCDDRLRDLLDTIREARLRATVMVVSDHGFKNVQRAIKLAPVVGEKARVIPEGGTAFIYLRDSAAREEVKRAVAAVEGVTRVYDESEFAALGMPTPAKNRQAPNLIAAARNGFGFSDGAGSHGFISSDPQMDGILALWGQGVRAGADVPSAESIDIAPTIAALLGIRMENVDGKVLTGLLR